MSNVAHRPRVCNVFDFEGGMRDLFFAIIYTFSVETASYIVWYSKESALLILF